MQRRLGLDPWVRKIFLFFFLINFFFFNLAVLGLSCSKWDLIPWQGLNPGLSALEAWSLSHWTVKEVQILSWREILAVHPWPLYEGSSYSGSYLLVLSLSEYYGTTVIPTGSSLPFLSSDLNVWDRCHFSLGQVSVNMTSSGGIGFAEWTRFSLGTT